MPVLQFKGKTAIECYHHTVSHHTLEFDSEVSALERGVGGMPEARSSGTNFCVGRQQVHN